jgi:hypothetical protein
MYYHNAKKGGTWVESTLYFKPKTTPTNLCYKPNIDNIERKKLNEIMGQGKSISSLKLHLCDTIKNMGEARHTIYSYNANK